MPEVAITVNSPGEVSTWLIPVVRELRKLDQDIRVTVFILPCTYAAGTETDVVASIPGIDAVVPPSESLKFALFGGTPRKWRRFERGALLFLGGEFFLAARLIRKLNAAGLAYSAGFINSASAFDRVFAPRAYSKAELVRRGVPEGAVEVVGDLMVDAAKIGAPFSEKAEARRGLGIDQDATVVALFPGSRPYEFRYALGFFARAAARLTRMPAGKGHGRELRFVSPVAPFIDEAVVREALAALPERGSARAEVDAAALARDKGRGVEGRFEFDGDHVSITFYRERSTAVIAAADLALTVPGSNTAEMAAWGLPMVVCVPLDKPEDIPIDGIFGLVDRIPLIGRRLKAKAVLALSERTTFVALPNRIANERIASELRSRTLQPEDVAEEAFRLLGDDEARAEMSRKLVAAMGPPGAAEKVARGLLEAAYSSAEK